MPSQDKVQEIVKWLTIQEYQHTSFFGCIVFIRTHHSYPMSVAKRMAKLNDAWEQEQIKSLSLYQKKKNDFQFQKLKPEFKTPVNLIQFL